MAEVLQKNMPDQFVAKVIEDLVFLEKQAGSKVQYRILPPLSYTTYDILSVQKLTKQIAEFIGIADYSFVVNVSKQKKAVAANIDLNKNSTISFIEISRDLLEFPNTLCATLAHEVSHKWLQINHASYRADSLNEYLTDIACVFLGFGKLLLNGYDAGPKNIGYLNLDQIAFVYRLVCAMRNIPDTKALSGLAPSAISAITLCDERYGKFYDTCHHTNEIINKAALDCNALVTNRQLELAEIQKHIAYTRVSFFQTIETFLDESHNTIARLKKRIDAELQGQEFDPALRFLQNVLREQVINSLGEELIRMNRRICEYLKHTESIVQNLHLKDDIFPIPPAEAYSIIVCPYDGANIRLPKDSGDIIVTCPQCNHQFAYNTNMPTLYDSPPQTISEPPEAQSQQPKKQKKTFWLFRKKDRSARV